MRNVIERAVWTGIQSGLAVVTVEGLVGAGADLQNALLVAGVATLLSALKTISQDRLTVLNPPE